MDEFEYGEVCPVSKAASVLCERWTLQIIREMLMGVTRFSEFQRYLPKISPALLNSRLKTLEEQDIIIKKKIPGKSGFEYQLTAAGNGLKPLIIEFGKWGMNWAFDRVQEGELNPSVIVRDFTYALDVEQLPSGECTIQFNILEDELTTKKFVLVRDNKAQYCDTNIGHEVEVYLTAELKTFYQIWFGECSLTSAQRKDKLTVVGPKNYTRNLSDWLRTSQFAPFNKNANQLTNE